MFVRYLNEYKSRPSGLPDELPWQSLVAVDPAILRTEDDGFLTTFRVKPHDFRSLTKAEQGLIMLRINEAFQWLEKGWAVWLHARRVPVTNYPESPWPHPVGQLLDDEWKAHLTAPGRRWTTETYLT